MMAPLARKLSGFLTKNPNLFAKTWSLWPPFLASGIRVDEISDDFMRVRVLLKLGKTNANYVGTHFGGSLFSMTDPFYMIMLLENLGNDYIVWDKAAAIDYKKPGRGTVVAEFKLEKSDLDEIRQRVEESEKGKTLWDKEVLVTDESGDTVAKIIRTIYVRKKNKSKD